VSQAHLRVVPTRGDGDGSIDRVRLEALQRGDPEVTAEVIAELIPRVRGWLLRLLGSRNELDDAVQDALTEIARALPRFEGRSTVAYMAHRITVRVAYRYFGKRGKSRETTLEVVPPPADLIDPESRAMGREALRSLYRCLDRLPKRRRVAFVLCAVEGLSPSEAAEVAGVSSTAMRSRLQHARKELARMLSGDPYVSSLMGRGTE
jgi:RNA polymerase sigma-70 factor (ECF subfamily)